MWAAPSSFYTVLSNFAADTGIQSDCQQFLGPMAHFGKPACASCKPAVYEFSLECCSGLSIFQSCEGFLCNAKRMSEQACCMLGGSHLTCVSDSQES